ncbi:MULTISPECIES: DUF6779 domain-containing protein [Gordonia]|nr:MULTISPECIES: DUF6779 domain-containing protein [Gordonia]AZZ83627.1 hypothetical protein C5O27_07970 [Gordonia alkanivorans]MDH3008375.1 hypothetical protein [Gordonia alkanivorans]MDH3012422.1 hypothetical protein [Gordonia alkanivorans]MDH3017235.1 hypothetical protein [Gordonia alkanivorans]MDH3021782.1 hypothetical protein [Gordonia alkanivorans]
MTTSNGRSADSRRSSRSAAQWLLGLLIVLALAASVLMVFTDRLSILGSLAVIAALWAAVIGAILVTKFRRQAESAEAKSRDLRLVYELQLEREIAARRQYELDVETTIRKEITAESNEELSELKAQVLALRSSLEMLLGEPLPDQRAALSSEKMRELASGLSGAHAGSFGGEFGGVPPYRSTYDDDGLRAARDFAATAPTADDGRHTGPVDPNEMTEVIPVITDDPISGRIATEVPVEEVDQHSAGSTPFAPRADESRTADAEDVSDAEVVDDSRGADESAAYTDETPTDEWATGASAEAPAETGETGAAPEEEETATSDVEAPAFLGAAGRHEGNAGRPASTFGGGRRRRAADDDSESAHSAGLPVSELLNQLRQQSGTTGGGRRRRD